MGSEGREDEWKVAAGGPRMGKAAAGGRGKAAADRVGSPTFACW